jgi:hypothetical protein
MEVSVRPITVSEELAAVGRTRARRCRAAPIERDADGDDRAGHGIVRAGVLWTGCIAFAYG